METDRLTRWLTLGANLGVLIGLLLLVGEIRQTNSIAKAEAVNAITQNYLTILQMQRDPRHIAALDRAEVDWEQLTKEEQILLSSVGAALFKIFETAYYQHKFGVYEDDQLASDLTMLDYSLEAPWLIRQWHFSAEMHSKEFRDFVNERLEEPEG